MELLIEMQFISQPKNFISGMFSPRKRPTNLKSSGKKLEGFIVKPLKAYSWIWEQTTFIQDQIML